MARHAAPPADAAFVAGDMREEFDHRVASLGGAKAWRWYWSEALRSCLPLVVRRFTSPAPSPITSQPNDAMWMSILADARHALRLGRRSKLASFAVIATMVLGIGSTTAVFSAMNAILLRPLPFPESSRVVQLNGVVNGQVTWGSRVSRPDGFSANGSGLRRRDRVFDE